MMALSWVFCWCDLTLFWLFTFCDPWHCYDGQAFYVCLFVMFHKKSEWCSFESLSLTRWGQEQGPWWKVVVCKVVKITVDLSIVLLWASDKVRGAVLSLKPSAVFVRDSLHTPDFSILNPWALLRDLMAPSQANYSNSFLISCASLLSLWFAYHLASPMMNYFKEKTNAWIFSLIVFLRLLLFTFLYFFLFGCQKVTEGPEAAFFIGCESESPLCSGLWYMLV